MFLPHSRGPSPRPLSATGLPVTIIWSAPRVPAAYRSSDPQQREVRAKIGTGAAGPDPAVRRRGRPTQAAYRDLDKGNSLGFDHVRRGTSGMSWTFDDLHRGEGGHPDLHRTSRGARPEQAGAYLHGESQCVPNRLNPEIQAMNDALHRPGEQKVPETHPSTPAPPLGRDSDQAPGVDTVETGRRGDDAIPQPRPDAAGEVGRISDVRGGRASAASWGGGRIGGVGGVGGVGDAGTGGALAAPRRGSRPSSHPGRCTGRRQMVGKVGRQAHVGGGWRQTRDHVRQHGHGSDEAHDEICDAPAGQPARLRERQVGECVHPVRDPLPLADHRRHQFRIITTSRGHHRPIIGQRAEGGAIIGLFRAAGGPAPRTSSGPKVA